MSDGAGGGHKGVNYRDLPTGLQQEGICEWYSVTFDILSRGIKEFLRVRIASDNAKFDAPPKKKTTGGGFELETWVCSGYCWTRDRSDFEF